MTIAVGNTSLVYDIHTRSLRDVEYSTTSLDLYLPHILLKFKKNVDFLSIKLEHTSEPDTVVIQNNVDVLPMLESLKRKKNDFHRCLLHAISFNFYKNHKTHKKILNRSPNYKLKRENLQNSTKNEQRN